MGNLKETRPAWDKVAGVVIVGFGYAGAMAAIEAQDLGSKPLILGKRPRFGGNSIVSGGAFRLASDAQGALKYLQMTCLNTTAIEVLEVVAQGLTEVLSMVEDLGRDRGLKYRAAYGRATYPLIVGMTIAGLRKI